MSAIDQAKSILTLLVNYGLVCSKVLFSTMTASLINISQTK